MKGEYDEMRDGEHKTPTTTTDAFCPPSVVCGAITYMDRLSYGGFFEEAEKRAKVGDKQVYCKNCGLCRWPEEQRTCDNFVRSDEHETNTRL